MATTFTEYCFTDVIFHACVLTFGLVVGDVHWITVVTHIFSSSACVCLAFFGRSTTTSTNASATLASFLVTITLVFDGLCVLQSVCDEIDETGYAPTALAFSAGKGGLVVFFVVVSVHVISCGAATVRLLKCHEWFTKSNQFISSGITSASICVYILWNMNFGVSDGQILRIHVFVFVIFLMISVVDCIALFRLKKQSKHHAWWIASCVLCFTYVINVVNFSRVFEEDFAKGHMASFLTHPYSSLCGRIQSVALLTLISGSIFFRIKQTLPKENGCHVVDVDGKTCIKAPASLAKVEPFASLCVTVANACVAILPLTCSIVAVFGDYTPMISRFVLLVYGSSLSLRFWMVSKTTNTLFFVIVNALGILTDLLVGLDVVFFQNGVVLEKRGRMESTVILCAELIAGMASLLLLVHTGLQKIQKTFSSKEKNM